MNKDFEVIDGGGLKLDVTQTLAKLEQIILEKVNDGTITDFVPEIKDDTLLLFRNSENDLDAKELLETTKTFDIDEQREKFPVITLKLTYQEIKDQNLLPDLEEMAIYTIDEGGKLTKVSSASSEFFICTDANTCDPGPTGKGTSAVLFRSGIDESSTASAEVAKREFSHVLIKGEPLSFSKFAVFTEKSVEGNITFEGIPPHTDEATIAARGKYEYFPRLFGAAEGQPNNSSPLMELIIDDDSVFNELLDPNDEGLPPFTVAVGIILPVDPSDPAEFGKSNDWFSGPPIPLFDGETFLYARYKFDGEKNEIKGNLFSRKIIKITGDVKLEFNEAENLDRKALSTSAGTKSTFSFRVNQESEVFLEISDEQGVSVKTLSRFIPEDNIAKLRTLVWDGTNAAGQVQAEGTYFYRLFARDKAGRTNENFGPEIKGFVFIDNTPPIIQTSSPPT